jgi:hypothetical protein
MRVSLIEKPSIHQADSQSREIPFAHYLILAALLCWQQQTAVAWSLGAITSSI